MDQPQRVVIIGGGNLGVCIARGLVSSGRYAPGDVSITRRRPELLEALAEEGFVTGSDNVAAVGSAGAIILCVQPQQLDGVLDELRAHLRPDDQIVISTVSGVSIAEMRRFLGERISVLRAMPNIGIAIEESMTCISGDEASSGELAAAQELFDA